MRFVIVWCVLLGCSEGRAPAVPASIDTWARTILSKPAPEVCADVTAGAYFCAVRDPLWTPEVRALGARSITLQNLGGGRYLDLDWGGGHRAAHGVIIGPADWSHTADPERRERKLRDGVFAYDVKP